MEDSQLSSWTKVLRAGIAITQGFSYPTQKGHLNISPLIKTAPSWARERWKSVLHRTTFSVTLYKHCFYEHIYHVISFWLALLVPVVLAPVSNGHTLLHYLSFAAAIKAMAYLWAETCFIDCTRNKPERVTQSPFLPKKHQRWLQKFPSPM